jgi:hypothetical protein
MPSEDPRQQKTPTWQAEVITGGILCLICFAGYTYAALYMAVAFMAVRGRYELGMASQRGWQKRSR